MKSFTRTLITLVFILGLSAMVAPDAWAASGIGIRPLRTNILINPGETATVQLTVINNENYVQLIEPEFQTYVSHDESGYPTADVVPIDDPRNIESWIDFGDSPISVPGSGEKTVQVTITAPADAAPGGRYGALVYGPVVSDTPGVTFRARVASLLLVQVAGEEVVSGEVSSFALKDNALYSDKGVVFETKFENTGNVHIAPEGSIALYDADNNQLLDVFRLRDVSGEEISLNAIPINPYTNYILPELKRNYESTWQRNIKPGSYRAELDVALDTGKPVQSQTVNFEVKDDLTISSFDLYNDKQEEKAVARVTFRNGGTVHQKISGTIDIYNRLEYQLAEIVIPADVPYIAPGDSYTHEFPLAASLDSGNYKIVSAVNYGLVPSTIEYEQTVTLGGNTVLWYVLIVLVAMGALGYALVLPRFKAKK